LLALPLSAWALALPRTAAVPGGIVRIELGVGEARPQAYFNKRRVMVVRDGSEWIALVGIPLSTKPGAHKITVKSGGDNRKISFKVADKKYATQRIKLKNKRMVDPNKQDMQRIGKERKRINAALSHWSDQPAVLGFSAPVDGPRSSSFGLRRFFNDQARAPHSGMDIAASKGAPIRAPAEGKIIEVGDFFFNGNSVFVDHGYGLVSMFIHLSEIDVRIGQTVEAGEVVGKVVF
jgi:murein DD-endopeptidase MepM/ murein hydrolase activator NlpD